MSHQSVRRMRALMPPASPECVRRSFILGCVVLLCVFVENVVMAQAGHDPAGAVVDMMAARTRARADQEGLAHCADPAEVFHFDDGRDYGGHVNVTETGIACQKWTAQSPHAHDTDVESGTDGVGDHNYCRNPNKLQRPWCFTTDPGIRLQFCDVGRACPLPTEKKTVTIYPSTGTHFANAGEALLSFTCFPRPCEVYYTLDGSEPNPKYATRFKGPSFQLTHSATVNYVALYDDGKLQYGVAMYTVQPNPSPGSKVHFIPTDSLTYTEPVLVSLVGTTAADHVVYFVNDTYKGKLTEPFWLNSSAQVVAVVNSSTSISAMAHYTIHATPPILTLFTGSGTYIGGTTVVVSSSSLHEATFYQRTNFVKGNATNETDWTVMTSLRVPITQVGITRLMVKAVYLGGLTSYAEAVYIIVEATPPVFRPSPLLAYTRPVRFVCEGPDGHALALFGAGLPHRTQDESMPDASEGLDSDDAYGHQQEVFSAHFAHPGTYEVGCSYTDGLGVLHTTVRNLTLMAAALPPPRFVPACEDAFPRTPLLLEGHLVAPDDNDYIYNDSVARLSLDVALAPSSAVYAAVDSVTRVSSTSGVYTYRLSPTEPQSSEAAALPAYVDVQLLAHSSDPMEDDSEITFCRYHYAPLGTESTDVVAARPLATAASGEDCYTDRDGNLAPECAPRIALQLARCLRFNTTDLISIHSVGTFVLMSVTHLDASIKTLYDDKLMACLSNESQVAVRDPVREDTGDVAVATGWRVALAAAGEPTRNVVPADKWFVVEVAGYHVARATDYRFVRDEYSCEDIGYHPYETDSAAAVAAMRTLAMPAFLPDTLTETEYGAVQLGEPSVGNDIMALVFSIPAPGRYKLCVRIADAMYVVPSRYAEVEPVLTTTPTPWRSVSTGGANHSCGGLVDVAHAELPIAVTFYTTPSYLSSRFYYSVDAAEWYVGTSGSAIVLPKKLNAYTNTVEVISASLGPAAASAAAVCVFYTPSVQPPISTSGIQYSFYKAANRTTLTVKAMEAEYDASGSEASNVTSGNLTAPHTMISGTADVVVSLHGSFQYGERVVLEFYEEVPSGNATLGQGSVGEAGEQRSMRLVGSVLGSPTVAAANATDQRPIAVPDAPLTLAFSDAMAPLHVRALLDGVEIDSVEPSVIRLSPLSLAMEPCKTCKSGYCYSDYACVCIGTVNKTAYWCTDGPTPVEPEVPVTPIYERLLLLGLYFALLAAIGVAFLLAIRRGAARSRRYAEEHEGGEADDAAAARAAPAPTRPRGGRAVDVTIEGDDESVGVP